MSPYVGDFRVGKTVRKMFPTNAIAGESITMATNGTVQVYKDGGTAQSTVGVTFTEDFDALTGIHLVAVDTSADGAFYAAGSDFEVVVAGAVVDGKTINTPLFSFSLENRSALMPTTDGRKLDVSAGGEAGLDWANVGSPTTVQNLSGTTVKTATDVETDTQDLQTKLGTPSDLGGGATVAANLADIEAQTDDIGVAGAGLTSIPWNAAWDAEVQSEVQDAIEVNNLDHLVKLAVDTDFPTTVHLNSVIGHLADNGTAATYDRTTDSLEVIHDDLATASTNVTTIVGVLSGITNLGNWLRALARKDAPNATALTELNTGGGAYDATTDSQEAIRDRGDAAWSPDNTTLGTVATNIARVLGLAGENMRVDVSTHSGSAPATATIYAYDTAAHAETHDGITGLIGKWSADNTYVAGALTAIKKKKIS